MRVGFILLPGFALTSFSLAMEAFSVANGLAGKKLYDCHLFGADEDAVVSSSNRVPVSVRPLGGETSACDLLIVCAYREAATYDNSDLFSRLRRAAQHGGLVAGLSGGSFILAKAGLLAGERCTIASELLGSFRELYPDVTVLEDVYTTEGNILTCAGGLSALDMVLYIIGRDHGRDFARQVAEPFLHDQIRSPEEASRSLRYLRLRMLSPALGTAVELMERHMDEPLSIETLADQAGFSLRSMELAFKKHLEDTPGGYYRRMRLKEAYRMLEETRLPVTVICQAAGFSSPSYFTKRFREEFGCQPSQVRSRASGG